MPDADPIATLCDSIIEITAEVTHRRHSTGAATARMDFGSLGVDSVYEFEIILQLEMRYSVTLTDTFLFNNRTPADAAQALHAMLATKVEPNPSEAGGSE